MSRLKLTIRDGKIKLIQITRIKHLQWLNTPGGKLRSLSQFYKVIKFNQRCKRKIRIHYAPFTDAKIRKLEKWQHGSTGVHPFTCCSHNGCVRSKREDEGILIPTKSGWVCPCGKYKQNWCYLGMVK